MSKSVAYQRMSPSEIVRHTLRSNRKPLDTTHAVDALTKIEQAGWENARIANAARFYVLSIGKRNEQSALMLLRKAINPDDAEAV